MVVTTPQPIVRVCRDCCTVFEISVEEQAFFEQLAAVKYPERTRTWCLPWRCTDCRRARRHERLVVVDDGQAEERRCQSCGATFTFTARDKAFFAARGWAAPRRCRACRAT